MAAIRAARATLALAQIDRSNVGELEVAWSYRTGELGEGFASRDKMAFEATPILAEGRLYLSTPARHRDRARSGDRRGALAPRSAHRSQPPLCRGDLARRQQLAGSGAARGRALRASDLPRHAGWPADRARRQDRAALRRLRRRRHGRSDPRRPPHQSRPVRHHLAARDRGRPRDHRLGDRRQPGGRARARHRARLRCAQRRGASGRGIPIPRDRGRSGACPAGSPSRRH